MDLFCERTGSGQPLLCIHGGFGLDHTYFRPWLDDLPAELVLPDLRGCGRSPRDGIAEASWQILSADLDELRARLGLDRWTVLGHSFGSYLAQDYALRYPEHVRGLILVGSAPAFDYPEVVGANLQKRGTAEQGVLLQRAFSGPLASDEEFRRGWKTLLPLYFHEFDPEIAAQMDERTIYSAPALWRGFQLLGQFDTRTRLGELKMPVLIFNGADDWITPPAQGGERLLRGIPNSRLEVFAHSGHFPFIEEQARFIEVAGAFLSGLSGLQLR